MSEHGAYTGTRTSEYKNTDYNTSSLYLCQAFTFRSCPGSFRLEQNVMPELLQIQFPEIYIYSGKHLFIVVLVGADLIHILKQSLNIPLGKMKDID